MYDHSRYLDTLSEFTRVLLTPYDVDVALRELAGRVTDVLDLLGSGVTLARDGRLCFDASFGPLVDDIERTQAATQTGPCVEAFRTGDVVAIKDLTRHRRRWPEYCRAAAAHRVASVAAIPMHLDDHPVGALNLYARGQRDWGAEDIAAACVMANMATAYLINASHHRRQVALNEQLQTALDSRVEVEQAKGMIAAREGCSTTEAFERLRRFARSHNVSVHDVARAVVDLGLTV